MQDLPEVNNKMIETFRSGLIFLKTSKTPYNGYVVSNKRGDNYFSRYYSEGILYAKGRKKNGMRYGLWEEYNYDFCEEEIIFVFRGKYEKGKKEGLWKEIDTRTQHTRQITNFRKGKEHGLNECYNYYRRNYKNGKRHGFCEWFCKNGQVHSKSFYIDGDYAGPHEEYSCEDGKLKFRTYYYGSSKNGNGIINGPYELYYSGSGYLEERGILIDGKHNGICEFYYSNGQLERRGNYKDGKQDGLWEYFNEDGSLQKKLRNGVKQE